MRRNHHVYGSFEFMLFKRMALHTRLFPCHVNKSSCFAYFDLLLVLLCALLGFLLSYFALRLLRCFALWSALLFYLFIILYIYFF